MNDLVDAFNFVEIFMWLIFAVAVVRLGARSASRRQAFIAAALFVLFAISDAVELQTGAWWRPWWLLVWKASCVVGIVATGISARKIALTKAQPNTVD